MDSGSTLYSDEQDDEDFDEIDEHVTPPPRQQSIDNLRFGQTDQWDALLPRPPDNLATYLQGKRRNRIHNRNRKNE